jgi:hypothetical protein
MPQIWRTDKVTGARRGVTGEVHFSSAPPLIWYPLFLRSTFVHHSVFANDSTSRKENWGPITLACQMTEDGCMRICKKRRPKSIKIPVKMPWQPCE